MVQENGVSSDRFPKKSAAGGGQVTGFGPIAAVLASIAEKMLSF